MRASAACLHSTAQRSFAAHGVLRSLMEDPGELWRPPDAVGATGASGAAAGGGGSSSGKRPKSSISSTTPVPVTKSNSDEVAAKRPSTRSGSRPSSRVDK